jgi:hypothetical protein
LVNSATADLPTSALGEATEAVEESAEASAVVAAEVSAVEAAVSVEEVGLVAAVIHYLLISIFSLYSIVLSQKPCLSLALLFI